jgi:diguanylate cyclase (GGDEF)-like protein
MASSDKSLELLLELGNPAARCTRADLIDHALRTTLALTDADAAAILSPTSRRGERLVLHAGSAAPATLPPPSEASAVVATLTESCLPLSVPDLADEPRIAASDGCPGVELGPAMYTPLRHRDPVLGYIAAYRRRGRARFTTSDTRLILMLSAWLSTALENIRLATGMERLAITDDLTEVYNSRFLQTALRRELRRASRYGEHLSVALIEVDNLAAYRDEYGAPRGGLLLREVATLLAQQVRAFDLMGRQGAERFMLVLPQTGIEGAVDVAERMRAAVEAHAFAPRAAGGITVSLGVASFPQEGAEATALVAKATRALMYAQQRGMNCVKTLLPRAA